MASKARLEVGSTPWIAAEKGFIAQVIVEEKSELVYPAQHAMEWLNEHMAEIFSKEQYYMIDVFKTPKKLRERREAPTTGSRIPLSEKFSAEPEPRQPDSSKDSSGQDESPITPQSEDFDMRAPELIAHEERMAAGTPELAAVEVSPERVSPFHASRARLQSMMANAKHLFARSASAVAKAEAEAQTQTPAEATAAHAEPAEPRRPPVLEKPKHLQPTAIRVGTLSQRVVSQSAKPKALLAAERKKEQHEREAQRRLEQKRELERKRAAQQEELRRQEQRQREEADRRERERVATEQAKRVAQQQAIEKKRAENVKKIEQQRAERAANDMTSFRLSKPASRPAAPQLLNRSLINHPLPTNPAKPPKRPIEEDAGPKRQQLSNYVATSQQDGAKRRRTNDEKSEEWLPRPTMSGAPIRRSNLGKKPSIFSQGGYAPAAPPHMALPQAHGQQPPQQQTSQQLAHPMMTAKYASGNKVPFAELPNPPQFNGSTSTMQQKKHPLVRSSPQYQNGEDIELPEIPTDSEDEVSVNGRNGFEIPDWASPTRLTEQLIRQEAIDGDAIFGPIAPIKIEEVFAKGNKERLKRLRERTSSANWTTSGDGLTLEEVKADKDERERIRLQGGWRYRAS